MGLMAEPSGIVTAASDFVSVVGDKLRVVCGACRRMPPAMKCVVRRAVVIRGAYHRVTREPFVYLDKELRAHVGRRGGEPLGD
ncbi:MAG: hypothetical protein SWK76_14275 [Actinomycetota bacterium]|nr:hypothetical protein [Actinomycetota bacterium]